MANELGRIVQTEGMCSTSIDHSSHDIHIRYIYAADPFFLRSPWLVILARDIVL